MFSKVKKNFSSQIIYLSVLCSFMLNTICSRIVDQTDLIMMKKIGEHSAAALITLKNFTFIDFIVALTFVPLFSVMIRKGNSVENKIELLRAYSRKYFQIVTGTFLFCAIFYPVLIRFCVSDLNLRKLCFIFLVPVILNLPGKMLQFYGTSILCSFNKAKYVSIIWICITILNMIFNILFISLFGNVGCLISTVVLTLIICFIIYYILQKNFQIFSKTENKIRFSEIKTPILSEGARIVIEKTTGYLSFFAILHFSSVQIINWTGIIAEIMNLLLVPLIASMRSSTISFSEGQDYKKEIKSKIYFNLVISILLSALFLIFFKFILINLYDIENLNSLFFLLFRILTPIILMLNSLSSIYIGFLQFKLQQKFYFKVNSIINWAVSLPLFYIIFSLKFEQFYILIPFTTSFIETMILGIKCKNMLRD